MGEGGPAFTRVMFETGQVRARNLRCDDVIQLKGLWRELLDVWTDETRHETEDLFGPTLTDTEEGRFIHRYLTGLHLFVVVRYIVERPDTAELRTSLAAFRSSDLITVQVPILRTVADIDDRRTRSITTDHATAE